MKYLCIHGHFYQPPRENPWLEVIEQQDSAYPFHDWNERITSECYAPNAHSRILDEEMKIIDIVNNYEKISFNFGATLLDWLLKVAPDVHHAIIDADKKSVIEKNGCGNAIAQVYNHLIMPLANEHDKETQVIWGIRDFEFRFGRKPQGMWLAETAVDTATLEVLASNGITYTILAPRQAKSIKPINNGSWHDVTGEKIDTRNAYLCKLPSGKSINLFFYDGELSQGVAFKGWLKDGKKFAEQLLDSFNNDSEQPQLVSIATDGESYGHHERYGDMALAFCIKQIEESTEVKLVNYAEFLALHPPKFEVEIYQNTSWSCAHGIERWRTDCGCNSGGKPSWNQSWRAQLRNSLDWLRNQISDLYEKQMSAFAPNVWDLRNKYISIVLERSEVNIDKFISDNTGLQLKGEEKTKFIRLLEMQRHSMLMYTSCGWFFDDISGIETIQILQYADRAMQLAESESDLKLEKEFLIQLHNTPGNDKQLFNAEEIHKHKVLPSRLTLSKVGSHYAVASLFEEQPESLTICNYFAESEVYERLEAGALKLAVGKTKVFSNITYSEKLFYFSVIYLGQNHIIGSATSNIDDDAFFRMKDDIIESFNHSRLSDVFSIMQFYFGQEKFSFSNLFKDEQRKVLNQIMQKDLKQAEDSYKKIYNRNYNLMNVLQSESLPVPQMLEKNLAIVINNEIKEFFQSTKLFPAKLEKLAEEVEKWNVELDRKEIIYSATDKMYQVVADLSQNWNNVKYIANINRVFGVFTKLDIKIGTLRAQNELFKMRNKPIDSEKFRQEIILMCDYLMMKVEFN